MCLHATHQGKSTLQVQSLRSCPRVLLTSGVQEKWETNFFCLLAACDGAGFCTFMTSRAHTESQGISATHHTEKEKRRQLAARTQRARNSIVPDLGLSPSVSPDRLGSSAPNSPSKEESDTSIARRRRLVHRGSVAEPSPALSRAGSGGSSRLELATGVGVSLRAPSRSTVQPDIASITRGFPYFKASQSPAGSEGDEVDDVETYQLEEIVSPTGTAAKLGPVRKETAAVPQPHQNLEEFLDLVPEAQSSGGHVTVSDGHFADGAGLPDPHNEHPHQDVLESEVVRTEGVIRTEGAVALADEKIVSGSSEETADSSKTSCQQDSSLSEYACAPMDSSDLRAASVFDLAVVPPAAEHPGGGHCHSCLAECAAASSADDQCLRSDSQSSKELRDAEAAEISASVQTPRDAEMACRTTAGLHFSSGPQAEPTSRHVAVAVQSRGTPSSEAEMLLFRAPPCLPVEHQGPHSASPEKGCTASLPDPCLHQEVSLLQMALETARECHEDSDGLIAQLRSCAEKQSTELASLREELVALQRDNRGQHKENEQLTEMCAERSRSHAECVEAHAATNESYSRTQHELTVTEQRLLESMSQCLETEAALVVSRSECQIAEEGASQLSADCCETLATLRVFETEHRAARHQLMEFESAAAEKSESSSVISEIESVTRKLAEAEDRLQGAWVAAQAWEERATAAEHMVNAAESSAVQWQREAASAQAHATSLARLVADLSPSVRPVGQVSDGLPGAASQLNEPTFYAAIAAADQATRDAEARASRAQAHLERVLGPGGEIAIARGEAESADRKRLEAETALSRESSQRASVERDLKRTARQVSDLERQITTLKSDERKAHRSATESVGRLDRKVRELEAALAKATSKACAAQERFELAVRSGDEQRRCAERALDAERASAQQAHAKSEKYRLRIEQLELRLIEAERRLACAVPLAGEVVVGEVELASLRERLEQQETMLASQAQALQRASESAELLCEFRAELGAALASESAAREQARRSAQETQSLRESAFDPVAPCAGFKSQFQEPQVESRDAVVFPESQLRHHALGAAEFCAGSEDESFVRPTPRSADAGAGACGAATTQVAVELSWADPQAETGLSPRRDSALLKEIESERDAALRDAAHFRMVAQQVAARCGIRQQELERDMQRWKSVAQALVVTKQM